MISATLLREAVLRSKNDSRAVCIHHFPGRLRLRHSLLGLLSPLLRPSSPFSSFPLMHTILCTTSALALNLSATTRSMAAKKNVQQQWCKRMLAACSGPRQTSLSIRPSSVRMRERIQSLNRRKIKSIFGGTPIRASTAHKSARSAEAYALVRSTVKRDALRSCQLVKSSNHDDHINRRPLRPDAATVLWY